MKRMMILVVLALGACTTDPKECKSSCTARLPLVYGLEQSVFNNLLCRNVSASAAETCANSANTAAFASAFTSVSTCKSACDTTEIKKNPLGMPF